MDKLLLANPIVLPEVLIEDEVRQRLEDTVRQTGQRQCRVYRIGLTIIRHVHAAQQVRGVQRRPAVRDFRNT